MENKQYGVYLLERFEYQYYHTINVDENRTIDKLNMIKKTGIVDLLGTENQYILKQRDYIRYITGKLTDEYKLALENENADWYESNKDSMRIRKDFYKSI